MLLSLLLLFGHQLVPHLHEAVADEMSIGKPESNKLGWLALVFSLDQGAEHLEHFRQISNEELAPDLAQWVLPVFALVYLDAPVFMAQQLPQIPPKLRLSLDFIAQAHQLRGPPSC